MNLFKNRMDAGQQLASHLLAYQKEETVLILALPRGGVPVAFEIAKVLDVPMTVFLVRKLGVPHHEELAMGAIAEGNVHILNPSLIQQLGVTEQQVQRVLQKEQAELNRRLDRYREGKNLPTLIDKTAMLVDDGIATGSTCKAAIQALRMLKPKKIILATPVASQDSLQMLACLVDEIVCLATPEPFYGVGQWYQTFDQTKDEEVLRLLQTAPVK